MQTGNCLCRGDGYFLVPVELHNQHLSHDYLFLFVFVKKINQKLNPKKKKHLLSRLHRAGGDGTIRTLQRQSSINPPSPPPTTS